ncbi:MAG TPA: kelch repeat-containing protein [Candidatus Limnocylindria bacterium]|nr:kelch repeat-containing protein [Candidatus Limnocylindria bacterium]
MASATSAASPATGASGVWEILDPAPVARIEAASAVHEGWIWLAGGLNADGSATDETWRYEPGTGAWERGPTLPEALHHAALVSTGESLLLIGGYAGASFATPEATVLALNVAGDGWEPAASLPDARAAGAAVWDGGRVLYAGGVTSGGSVSRDVLAFDDEQWSVLGQMVAPREHLAAATHGDGRAWLLGGRTLSLESNVGTVEYVEGSVVARVGELPTPRGGTAAFYLPSVGACLSGGEEPNLAYDVVECIDEDLQVTTLPPLAEPRHGHAAAVVDGAVYVLLGGPQPRLTVSDTVQRFVPGMP